MKFLKVTTVNGEEELVNPNNIERVYYETELSTKVLTIQLVSGKTICLKVDTPQTKDLESLKTAIQNHLNS
jgi:uncharacterized protein YlzI (FlbEa/FlbD family)